MCKTVLITGASSGIGYELARLFARNGYNLVLTARNEQKLIKIKQELETKDITVEIIPLDLSINGSAEVLYETVVKKRSITINVLVNNAGYGLYGYFHENDLDTEMKMIHLNIATLTHLTKLFVKDMVKRREGKILNLASTAAFQPGPMMAVYFATKAYVLSFSEALANELKEFGITVTALCPGPTETEFGKTANVQHTKLFMNAMSADKVAEMGYKALMRGKALKVSGVLNTMGSIIPRFLPRRMVVNSLRKIIGRK